eukprot:TRINITY_DN8223_c0_g1_i1.p1 TRINITY_DN8223_c0_g1~~TRINITY_DN8223_c0_g1_i1.p1  ORF type:complete len:966 (+),score=403.53 TRINITY_DN8223_c0_g1_i1:116-3013(+)
MPPKKASSVKKKRAKKPGGKKRGAAPLTEEAICRDLFARVGNGNDRVTPEQFRELMKVVTPAAPAAVCDEIVAVADEDRGGDIDFGEFYDLLSGGYLGEKPSVLLEKYKAGLVRIEKAGGYDAYVEKLPAPAAATPEEAKEILHARLVDYLRRTADPKALFRSLFDLMNEKRDGFLDREQLEKMVRLVMPRCTPELAAAVVKSADHNESGDVDFEEFCAAVEAGSFGMTAEELQPLFQRALKKMKDQGVVPPPPPATEGGALDEAALRKGEEDMKKLQEAAAKRREQLKAEADEKKRQRLRSRLVDFYAKHNPDKVREADISKVVGTAMQRGITEDDLFRTLYKKYNLDEAGEPRQDFVDSDWDATSSDVDETQMSEEERRAYRLKQQQKAEYRLAKKEEALHKAAQAVIKKETKAERAMAKTARERFLEGWKSVETLLREGKEREEKAAMAAAEEKLQRNEDVYHRGLNRKVWLRALDEAKQQLFEEKCVKNDAKRVYKRLKRKVYQHRAELKVTKATLDDLRNRQVAWVQNIRLAETLLEGQEELNASMRPPQDEFDANRAAAAALEQEIGELQEQIAKLRIDRNDYTLMHAAHRQYRLTLEEVVAGLEAELEEREASIDIFRDECIESVDELRAGSAADLEGLREKFNAELEKLQREVQRSEELRSEDKHYQDTRARGIRHNIVVYTEQCSDEIATLEQRLLELYPSVLRDLASSVGKASIHGVPVPSIDGPASGAARQPLIYTSQKQQPLAEHVVAALSVYKPRDMYVMSGAALPDEYSCVVQADDEIIFDMAVEHGGLPGGAPAPLLPSPHRTYCDPAALAGPSHCELLDSRTLRALHAGAFAPLWRRKLGFTDEDASVASGHTLSEAGGDPEAFHDVRPGLIRRWLLKTERGCTLEVTVACTPPGLLSTPATPQPAASPDARRTPRRPATPRSWQKGAAPTPPVPPPSASTVSLLSDVS